jgi:hypothetical protein
MLCTPIISKFLNASPVSPRGAFVSLLIDRLGLFRFWEKIPHIYLEEGSDLFLYLMGGW